MTDRFAELTAPLALRYTFNPSFHMNADVSVTAFRGIPTDSNESISYISITDATDHTLINLSDSYTARLNVPRLIDPKVFALADGIYTTFHSGHVECGNDIFLMKVHPEIGTPKRVHYSGRARQERNWAFFTRAGELYALYWLNPLTVLKCTEASTDTVTFEPFYTANKPDPSIDQNLTIGTPLTTDGTRHYVIAHKKIHLRGKKMYLGKLCALDLEAKSLTTGSRWLTHSLPSMLGEQPTFNDNLFSCTYFSGAQIDGSTIRLGYGVNDLHAGFAWYEHNKLL